MTGWIYPQLSDLNLSFRMNKDQSKLFGLSTWEQNMRLVDAQLGKISFSFDTHEHNQFHID